MMQALLRIAVVLCPHVTHNASQLSSRLFHLLHSLRQLLPVVLEIFNLHMSASFKSASGYSCVDLVLDCVRLVAARSNTLDT
jgi:hypothetical protein